MERAKAGRKSPFFSLSNSLLSDFQQQIPSHGIYVLLEQNGMILHFQEDFVWCSESRNWTFSSNRKSNTQTSELWGAGKHGLSWESVCVELCMDVLDVLWLQRCVAHVRIYVQPQHCVSIPWNGGKRMHGYPAGSAGGDHRGQGGEKTLMQI